MEISLVRGGEGSFPVSTRVVEFFAGIGGLSASWPEASIVAAIDINGLAASVYRQNFNHPYYVCELQSLADSEFVELAAELWWLSPPCQPYTRRGMQRDMDDRRSAGLLHAIQLIDRVRPSEVVLENVVGFEASQSRNALLSTLTQAQYEIRELRICPSEFGWPNRRPRYYLLASRQGFAAMPQQPQYELNLAQLLEDPAGSQPGDPALWLDAKAAQRYETALDRVSANDALALTACFGSSYGKSLLKAGSYLRVGDCYRRFTPREVARLLGFADSFELGDLSTRQLWRLLGNSLSLPAVRYVLSHFPNGPAAELPDSLRPGAGDATESGSRRHGNSGNMAQDYGFFKTSLTHESPGPDG